MIIIGEKLNSSIKSTFARMEKHDEEWIKNIALSQLKAGADFVDVNAGAFDDEPERLLWAVTAAASSGSRIFIDSANHSALVHVLENTRLADPVINSISLETERLQGVLPLVKRFSTGVVAMPVSDDGMPATAEERVENASKLVEILHTNGVPFEKIFIDVMVETAATDHASPSRAIEASRALRARFPQARLTAGLSNVSFGLPKRNVITTAFLTAAIYAGLDSAIMDALNPDLLLAARAAELIAGRDEYAMNYLEEYRGQISEE